MLERFFDSLFSSFAWYRRLTGGVWYRIVAAKVAVESTRYEWSRCPLLGHREELAQTEVYAKSKPHVAWFIGGHDTEMEEILRILHATGQTVVDHNLGWGAKVSAYSSSLNLAGDLLFEETPMLVELENDLGLPHDQVGIIDHHGPWAGIQPPSITQVCRLLHVRMSWWQKAIAALDGGWYPALAEVDMPEWAREKLVKEDLLMQGFSDEMIAESKQLATAVKIQNGLAVIRLPFSKFMAAKAEAVLRGASHILCIHEVSREVELQAIKGKAPHKLSQLLPELGVEDQWSGGDGLHSGLAPSYVGCYWPIDKSFQELEQLVKSL